MDTVGKAKLTDLIHHVVRFLKLEIPTYNSEVPDTAGRKTRRRRRAKAAGKHFAFDANAKLKKDFASFASRELEGGQWDFI